LAKVLNVKMRFSLEEDIYGRWPGSSLFYPGIVKDYHPHEDKYTIMFANDEGDMTIPAKDIMKKVTAESQRSPSRARSKSPGRRRRRSRSPARPKSPGRPKKTFPKIDSKSEGSVSPTNERRSRTRSPRSPARAISQRKATAKKEENVAVKKEEKLAVKKVESEKCAAIEKTNMVDVVTTFADSTVETISHSRRTEEVRMTSTSFSAHDTSSIESKLRRRPLHDDSPSVITHRMSTRSFTKSLDLQKPVEEKKSELIECDELQGTPETLMSKLLNVVMYLSSSFFHIVLLFVPVLFVLGMYITCGKKSCTLLKFPKIPKFEKLFTVESVLYMFGWFILQAVLSALPLGKLVFGPELPDKTRLQYRLNALPSFFASLAVAVALVKYKYVATTFVVNKLPALIIASFIVAFVLSIAVFIQSRYSPSSSEPSDGFFPDFVFGRLSHPRLFNGMFHVKNFAFKSGFITWGVLNMYYLLKSWASNPNIQKDNTSLVLLTTFQMWYIIKTLYYEETLLYTATLTSEKMGYLPLSMMTAACSFFCAFQARYLYLYPVALPWYCYIIPVLLQVAGSYIYTTSIFQKFNFRNDPHSAIMSGVDHIKTSNGKHILVDGWWGRLRHPNYTGDLMMNVAWSALCGFHHLHPWAWSILLFFILIGMAVNDDRKCLHKYKTSWEEYRRRVKYSVVPFIY